MSTFQIVVFIWLSILTIRTMGNQYTIKKLIETLASAISSGTNKSGVTK